MRNDIPYTVENAYLTPPEPDEVINRAIWRVKEAKEEKKKVQSEYEDFRYLIRDARYLPFDIQHAIRSSYEKKLGNLNVEIDAISENLREKGIEA